jgi:hypothetical protein
VLTGKRMKKRKKKTLDVGKEARRAARQSGLAPATTRVLPDKRKRPPKHKQRWLEEETI